MAEYGQGMVRPGARSVGGSRVWSGSPGTFSEQRVTDWPRFWAEEAVKEAEFLARLQAAMRYDHEHGVDPRWPD